MWLKTNCVLVGLFLSLMSVTSASAASREIEDFFFEQLQKATLPLRPRGAGEAFMANCIANLTPTPTKKRKSYLLRSDEACRSSFELVRPPDREDHH